VVSQVLFLDAVQDILWIGARILRAPQEHQLKRLKVHGGIVTPLGLATARALRAPDRAGLADG